MFILTGFNKKELKDIYKRHRICITTENVYYHNTRALKTRNFEMISNDTYTKHIRFLLQDIKVESEPIETVIPNDQEDIDEGRNSIFSINTEIDEFKRVQRRLTYEEVIKLLPKTNNTYIKITEHPEKIDLLVEEIFIHFLVEKYYETIDQLHLAAVSNMTPLIEYVVKNIDEKTLKSFIHTKRINFDKVEKVKHDIVFKGEFRRTVSFYTETHGSMPIIDVEKILGLLITNADTEDDITFVTALYYILSFAMVDIANENNNPDDFPCVLYIRDVLSRLQ